MRAVIIRRQAQSVKYAGVGQKRAHRMLVSGDGGADRAFGTVFPAHINRSAVKGKADALIGSAVQHGKRRFKHGVHEG